MERIIPKKLNEFESEEKYRVKVSNGSAALGGLDAEVDNNNNNAWETIGGNMTISATNMYVIMD
jgi:hypothetical protein